MSATVAGCSSICGPARSLGSLGDSRILHFRRGTLPSVTRDTASSSAWSMQANVAASHVSDHPNRNLLYGALGQRRH